MGPYFLGSDPASRERTALEQTNHESNVKIVVSGGDPTPLSPTLPILLSFFRASRIALSSSSRNTRPGFSVSSSNDRAPFSTSSFRWSWRGFELVFQNPFPNLLLEELRAHSGSELPRMEPSMASRVDVRTRLRLLRSRAKGHMLIPQSCKGHGSIMLSPSLISCRGSWSALSCLTHTQSQSHRPRSASYRENQTPGTML